MCGPTGLDMCSARNTRVPQLPPQLQTPDDDWPEVMPPYIQGEIMFSPDGDVIFRRQPSADHPGIAYYVVDRRGRLLGVIDMKNKRTDHRVRSAVALRR